MSYALKCSNCLRERPRAALFVSLHYAVCIDKEECNRWVVDKPLPPAPAVAPKGLAPLNPGVCEWCQAAVRERVPRAGAAVCVVCSARHMQLLVRDAQDAAERQAYRAKRRGEVEVDDDPWDETENAGFQTRDKLGPIGRKRRAS